MSEPVECDRTTALVSDLLAGLIEPEDAERLEGHLSVCRACGTRAAALFRQHRALAELAAETTVEDLLARIGRRISPPVRTPRTSERAWLGKTLRTAVLLAASVLVVLSLLTFTFWPRLEGSGVPKPSDLGSVRPPGPKNGIGPVREKQPEAPAGRVPAPEARAGAEAHPPSLPPGKPTAAAARETEKEPPKDSSEKRPVDSPPAVPRSPVPPPDQEPPSPRAPGTLAAVGKLEEMAGEVYLVTGDTRVPAWPGHDLRPGQSLQTIGALSLATLKLQDGTRVQLWRDTVLHFPSESERKPAGKHALVRHGTIIADVAKQVDGRPMVFATAQGEAKILGTLLRISFHDGAMRLEVKEGKVELTRSLDGKAVEVARGQCAVAAAGVELTVRPLPQEAKNKAAHPKVDQKKVDLAVSNGITYLRSQVGLPQECECEELVLWTLVHAGIPEADPAFAKLFKVMMDRPLQRTYNVSLQAMLLEELDRVKYQKRIAQCGQFLIDNQCKTGQWSYGEPTPFADDVPTSTPKKDVATEGKGRGIRSFEPNDSGKKSKPDVRSTVTLRKKRDGPEEGDNSNSQYAALGLRACYEAGVVLPVEVVKRARDWWRENQCPDQGWWYKGKLGASYGSMTAGGLGSLAICHYLLQEPWRQDECVLQAIAWLTENFTVKTNPHVETNDSLKAGAHTYYYLYALERAGILYGTETFGAHEWYPEGAQQILKTQNKNGSWGEGSKAQVDTCFAILFLKRGTRVLAPVASVDRYLPQK
jgi:hypothetical protein